MPSDSIHPGASGRSMEVRVSTASSPTRLHAASKSKSGAAASAAIARTPATACANCRCRISCRARTTFSKRSSRSLAGWRSRMRAKSAMQRSSPLRSVVSK